MNSRRSAYFRAIYAQLMHDFAQLSSFDTSHEQ